MLRRRGLGAGVTVAVIALGGVRPLLAQAPPAAPAAQASQPAGTSQPTQQLGGLITRYLVDSPQVLNLTPKQVERVRKQLTRLDSADAPLRA
jgi:hypothetical protein